MIRNKRLVKYNMKLTKDMIKKKTYELLPTAKNGDSHAVKGILYYNHGLIMSIVNKYAFYDKNLREDLIQSGYEGMIKAIRSYDFSQGIEFISYAYVSVKNEIRREKERQTPYTVSPHIQEAAYKTKRLIEDYYNRTGKQLSSEQIMQEIGLGTKEAYEKVMYYLNSRYISLDDYVPMGEKDSKKRYGHEVTGQGDNLSYHDFVMDFYNAIKILPAKQKELLILKLLYEMETRALALRLELTTHTVSNYLLHDRKMLRKKLSVYREK